MEHLDEMTCLLYIERQLDRMRAQEVSAHVQDCPQCRTLLRALERESRLLTRAMLEEEEALPARLMQFQERARRSLQWIWGLAFGLAATGLYALYTGYIEPWEAQLEQAGFGSTNLVSLLIFQGAFWKGWTSMVTLLEVVAMLTLGGVGFAYVRRRVRRGAMFALMLAGVCGVAAMAVTPSIASASDFRRGDFVEVAQDETIKGDVFLFGHRVRVNGTVEGDVFLFSEDASVTGTVKGDVIAFAQSLHLPGHVEGNVRAFTNNLTISGDVARNVLTFDESVNLDSAGKIGRSLTVFTKSLSLDGQLGRDLLVFSEHTGISGKVGGTIDAKGASLDISSTAQVDGPVRFEGDRPAEVASGAKLASPVEYHRIEHKQKYAEGHYYVWQLIWTAAFVLFGLVLFLLMPQFSRDAVDNVEKYGASFGLGVLVFFGVPIAALIACITVVGLFIGLATGSAWFASLFYAQVVVGAMVGQWLMGRTRELWPLIGRMAVGIVIVRLCTNIPAIGGWVKFGTMLWGVGAISLALYRRFQPVISTGLPAGPLPVGGAQPA